MNTGQYTQFYVKRKAELFPLIEKYANLKITKNVTHGNLVPLYHRLLSTNPTFRAEVDDMIAGRTLKKAKKVTGRTVKKVVEPVKPVRGYNATGTYLPSIPSLAPKVSSTTLAAAPSYSPTTKSKSGSGAGILAGIVGAVGSIFSFGKTRAAQKAASDEFFYETVLIEQRKDDTMKVVIISGVALAFMGLGIYLVMKAKK